MSLTVIQRFYEVAKQEADAYALGIEYDGAYHDLPWWFVKSKAKHFGLGLLEDQAHEGEYFYLFPSSSPAWIYAELGALTMRLKTVPLPAKMELQTLENLFEKYPPAFIFLGDQELQPFHDLFNQQKTLHRLIMKEDSSADFQQNLPMLSFRKVFNAGVRNESKHHETYRKIRQSLVEAVVMSPIQVDTLGHILEKPLHYGDVNALVAKLSHVSHKHKIRKIFSDVDWSCTLGRIACLYWPIFMGIQSIFKRQNFELIPQLQRIRPDVAYLKIKDLQTLEGKLGHLLRSFIEEKSKSGHFFNFWKKILATFSIKRKLGGRLHFIMSEETLPEEVYKLLAAVKIQYLSLQ